MTTTAQHEITTSISLRSLHQRRSCPTSVDSPQAGVLGGRLSVPSKLLLVSGDDNIVVGNKGSRNSICILFLVIVATLLSSTMTYKLGHYLATLDLHDVSSTDAERNDAPPSSSSSRLVINTANMSKLDQSLLPLLAESTPFIRGQVITTILERFTARNPLTTSRIDRLADAFDAMGYLEDDGEAIQVVRHPFLFVGSIGKQLYSKYFVCRW